MDSDGNINFGDIKNIQIPLSVLNLKAKVHGKILGANAYIISLFDPDGDLFRNLILFKSHYGYPIRQIKLQWGRFDGSVNEFIVPGHELKE
jgi:hypothetical protein